MYLYFIDIKTYFKEIAKISKLHKRLIDKRLKISEGGKKYFSYNNQAKQKMTATRMKIATQPRIRSKALAHYCLNSRGVSLVKLS